MAHKSTGEKGIIFTVRYMERFEEMEQELDEIKEVVEEQGAISKEEFYEIHFKNTRRVRKAFACPFNEYESLTERYLDYVATFRDSHTRIKMMEDLKHILDDKLAEKRADKNIDITTLQYGAYVTVQIQLCLEEKLETIKNRSYAQKLRYKNEQ